MIRLSKNQSLERLNTFGIDVNAKFLGEITYPEDLEDPNIYKHLIDKQFLTIGGGSNILFTKDFEGVVLHNKIMGKEIIADNSSHTEVRFGAGENWHETVLWCLKNNFGGMENLSLIPGSMGAAPIQNIGAYGQELQNIFVELEAFHVEEKRFIKIHKSEMNFGYRSSIFKGSLKNKAIITTVTLKLSKLNHHIKSSYASLANYLKERGINHPSIQDISSAVIAVRQSKLPNPKELGNAGSFFKNPVISVKQFEILLKSFSVIPHYILPNESIKIPAAWLIERTGWKNFRKNNFGTYPKQPLVLVNYGNSSGLEIKNLSLAIIESVKKKFNIELQAEVNIL